MNEKAMLTLTAGALTRGMIRRSAFLFGLKVEEEKGFLESAFRLTGPREDIEEFARAMSNHPACRKGLNDD